MTDFSSISDTAQGLWGLLALLVVSTYMYNGIRYLQLGRRKPAAATMLILLCSFLLMQVMMMNSYWAPFYPFGIHLKTPLVAASLFLLLALAFLQQRLIVKWSRINISNTSIKEAFDHLPTGLCYYLPGGIIKLVNTRMNAVCYDALGTPLMDPEGFWNSLVEGTLEHSVQGGENPILRFTDGTVYSFRHRVMKTGLGPVHELLCMDVSRDYALNLELQQKQKKAEAINIRLKALLGSIEYLTMSRELLQLKSELHDELGQSLLMSKRWLLDPGSMRADEVRADWLSKLRRLEMSEPESWQKPYYILGKQAEALGLALEIHGDLPGESRLIPVVETAVSVQMTNVLRHAGGTKAVIDCRKTPGGYVIEMTNDGMQPQSRIREGGGLSNLRSSVEALGGTMDIESQPLFKIHIFLPLDEV